MLVHFLHVRITFKKIDMFQRSLIYQFKTHYYTIMYTRCNIKNIGVDGMDAYLQPIRGVHIDFRAQKLKEKAVINILYDLKRWGYNTVLLEYMDAFPFDGKLSCLAAPDALTKDEVLNIISVANKLDIELIPLLQCFGHSYWILRHEEFKSLGEGWYEGIGQDELEDENGWAKLHTICPSDPRGALLFRSMAEQILKLHTNCKQFHIGGDEIGIPSCPCCKKHIEENGFEKLLTSHYLKCAQYLNSYNIKPVMWCDIVLAYPETLESLCGHVTMMDWDYWSQGEPTKDGLLWGLQKYLHRPDDWPLLQQKLFRPYFYYSEPELINPFPYTRMLRDQGFDVILACAARSAGDSFCIPSHMRAGNVRAAINTARDADIEGFMITSWAVRRSPWPLTEYALITGAKIMKNPNVSRSEINCAFALEHFGVEDDKLGGIPMLLGEASYNANRVGELIASKNEFSDYKTGNFFAPSYTQRIEKIKEKPKEFLENFKKLQVALNEASVLLDRACPVNEQQIYRTELWRWSIEVLSYYCDFAPQMLIEKGCHDSTILESFKARAIELDRKTVGLLSKIYTERTLEGESQTRFGVNIKYINEMIGGHDS